jgi:hypothetical protein
MCPNGPKQTCNMCPSGPKQTCNEQLLQLCQFTATRKCQRARAIRMPHCKTENLLNRSFAWEERLVGFFVFRNLFGGLRGANPILRQYAFVLIPLTPCVAFCTFSFSSPMPNTSDQCCSSGRAFYKERVCCWVENKKFHGWNYYLNPNG